MSINYNYGFLPMPIVDDSTLVAPSPYASQVPITGIGLSALCKLWWLSKGFDWSVNITYAFSLPSVSPAGTFTCAGTLSGSGTYSDSTYPPSRRTYFQDSPATSQFPLGYGFLGALVDAGTWSAPSGRTPWGTGASYSRALNMAGLWFCPQTTAAGISVVTSSGGDYITRIQNLSLVYGYNPYAAMGENIILPGADGGPLSPAGISLTIKNTGAPDVVLPYYLEPAIAGQTATRSGSVVLNFNNFWTP